MSRGKYIVLEGPEGVGKTTQIQELARRLQAAGLPVRVLREPDSQSDLTARALRQLTQDPRYPMNTNTEVLLYNAARSQSLQVIKKSVEQGVICVVDRNYLTTLAIQYYGRGDVPDYDTINRIISFAVNGVEPDLCIVLDAPVNILSQRAKDRGHGERFDNLDEAFLERVRAGYLWEARQRDLPVIFATEDSEAVANEIWKLVAESLAVRDSNQSAAAAPVQSIREIIDHKKQQAVPEPITPLKGTIATESSTPKDLPSNLSPEAQELLRTALKRIDSVANQLAAKAKLSATQQRALRPVSSLVNSEQLDALLNMPLSNKTVDALLVNVRSTHGQDDVPEVTLVAHQPRNELDVIPRSLYSRSNLPLSTLITEVTQLPYEQKAALLTSSEGPDTSLAHTEYTLELASDFATLDEVRQLTGGHIEWQQLTPRYGFRTPQALTDELSDAYAACFDLSLELHSQLQAAGFQAESQLATLGGHLQHCLLTISAAQLQTALRDTTKSAAAKRLLKLIRQAVSDVHPLVAEALASK